jgi:hypothetical protein
MKPTECAGNGCVVLDFQKVGQGAGSMHIHIDLRARTRETVCAVTGVIDPSAANHLSNAVQVALDLAPFHSVLVDLTQVDWMTLIEVRAAINLAQRARTGQRVVVRLTADDGTAESDQSCN